MLLRMLCASRPATYSHSSSVPSRPLHACPARPSARRLRRPRLYYSPHTPFSLHLSHLSRPPCPTQSERNGDLPTRHIVVARGRFRALVMLVWNSPRREGMLPAGDKRGNWNVTWFPADVWPGLGMYFPRLRKRGLSVCPGMKRRELEGRRFHRGRGT
jgi:hypothetical protein